MVFAFDVQPPHMNVSICLIQLSLIEGRQPHSYIIQLLLSSPTCNRPQVLLSVVSGCKPLAALRFTRFFGEEARGHQFMR